MRAERTDQVVPQTFGDALAQRVRLSGYFSASTAAAIAQTSPEEFEAEQVGVDEGGQAVFQLFWRTPRRAEA